LGLEKSLVPRVNNMSINPKNRKLSTLRVEFYEGSAAPQSACFTLTSSTNARLALKTVQALVSAAVYGNYDKDERVSAYADFFVNKLTTGGSVAALNACIKTCVDAVPKDRKAKHGFIARDRMLWLRFTEDGRSKAVRICGMYAPNEEDGGAASRGGLVEKELLEMETDRFSLDVTDAVAVAKSVAGTSSSATFKSHLAGYILSMPSVNVTIAAGEKGEPSKITVVLPPSAAAKS
jgi:hypothetical protein